MLNEVALVDLETGEILRTWVRPARPTFEAFKDWGFTDDQRFLVQKDPRGLREITFCQGCGSYLVLRNCPLSDENLDVWQSWTDVHRIAHSWQ